MALLSKLPVKVSLSISEGEDFPRKGWVGEIKLLSSADPSLEPIRECLAAPIPRASLLALLMSWPAGGVTAIVLEQPSKASTLFPCCLPASCAFPAQPCFCWNSWPSHTRMGCSSALWKCCSGTPSRSHRSWLLPRRLCPPAEGAEFCSHDGVSPGPEGNLWSQEPKAPPAWTGFRPPASPATASTDNVEFPHHKHPNAVRTRPPGQDF